VNYKAISMPIYDFQCTSCGHKDELMRKISEPTTTNCPECGKETFAKMLSAPSFQLSGSGWYASDFKDKKSSNSTALGNAETKSAAPETKSKEPETKAASCSPGCACH
jgi:putative FmdB family regulatory protein